MGGRVRGIVLEQGGDTVPREKVTGAVFLASSFTSSCLHA